MCDDDCPDCGLRHIAPLDAEDLTIIVAQAGRDAWCVLFSPVSAEHQPDYQEHSRFPTEAEAQAQLIALFADEAAHE